MATNERLLNPRYEIIEGEIVMMTPSPSVNRNTVITNLSILFGTYLKGKKCRSFTDGVDVHLDEQNTVIPDSMIICNKDIIKHKGIYGAPDLIVEVLSPATARHDKMRKKMLYEKHGVKEYWIINPTDKSIEVYLLNGAQYILDNVYTVIPNWQWVKMTDEEKSEVALTFKVSFYDDLILNLEDIFDNID
ncbi:Uma2 family endonuclease [Metasolibacillus meyeri]|uniref:Uma2 family endonuclease n=1 Tax=Metasolibacillus meyeri TaxID=1071052 RepID=UPI000D310489|nr:Uma2 family endonuclease [Metasolibacillus meyeri]